MENISLGLYENTKDTTGKSVLLQFIINWILSGNDGLAAKTKRAKKIANTKKKYRTWKAENLPAVTFSGIFPPGQREAHCLCNHTGFIIIDIDGLTKSQLGYLFTELRNFPQVILAFISPSGKGIKVLVRVEPIPKDHIEHKGAFEACVDLFRLKFEEFDIKIGKPKKDESQDVGHIDTSGSDCSRLCFLAHDPQIIVRENTVPIQWDRQAYLKAQEKAKETAANYDGDVDITALDYIDADDYEIWIKVGMACYRSGVPRQVWDQWSQESEKYEPGECAYKWETFQQPEALDQTISWGTVVYLAKQNGYDPKNAGAATIQDIRDGKISPLAARRPTQKLLKNNDEILLARIDQNREAINKALRQPKRVILLKSWTGDGKGSGCIGLALDGEKLMMGASTEQNADEDAGRFRKAAKQAGIELNVFRYKALKYGFNKRIPVDQRLEKGAMCAYADTRAAHQRKGGNGYLYCRDCEFYKYCQEHGYLSQAEKMKQADVLIFCFPSIVTDPDFFQQAMKFIELPDEPIKDVDGNPVPQRDNNGDISINELGDPIYKYHKRYRTVIFDEATTQNLYVNYKLQRGRIEQWQHMWKDEILGEFAENMLYTLDQEDPIPILRRIINEYKPQADTIIAQMHALRYPTTFTPTPSEDKFKGYMFINKTQTKIPVAKNWEVYNRLKEEGTPILKPNVEHKTHLNFRNLDDAVFYGLFDRTNPDSIHEMPRVESNKTWTYWHKLKALFDEFPHDVTLPLTYRSEPEGYTLHWHIHPQLHSNVPRIIFMGASLDIPLAKEALRNYSSDIFVTETPPTQFVPGAQYLQLTSALYPRSTLLTQNDGKYIRLAPSGRKIINRIRKEIGKKPDKRFGLVTFDWIVTQFKATWRDEHPNLVYFENFYQAEGTNPELDILFVLGTPEIPEHAVVLTAKRLFGATQDGKTPLNTARTRRDRINDEYPYEDPRMQIAWKLEVQERILQAIGRARLNLYPRCAVVLTAVRLPNLTDRTEAVLFDLTDWEIADGLDKLPETVSNREQETIELMYLAKNNLSINTITNEKQIPWRRVADFVTQTRESGAIINLDYRGEKVTNWTKLTPLQYAIRACFKRDTELRAVEIAKNINRARSKVSTELTELTKQGVLENVRRGVYRLSEEAIRDAIDIENKIYMTFMLDLGARFDISSRPDSVYQLYTNVQIGSIVNAPLREVNIALSEIKDSGWCLIKPKTDTYSYVSPQPWKNPPEHLAIYTHKGKLMAYATLHKNRLALLCDYNAIETENFQGSQDSDKLDTFLDLMHELSNADDDAVIYCEDLNEWGYLPAVPMRVSINADEPE